MTPSAENARAVANIKLHRTALRAAAEFGVERTLLSFQPARRNIIMTFSLKTVKMLWGRGASRCALCRRELVMDATEIDDPSIVGENCHIVAEAANGPRGDATFPSDSINLYGNLILLCNVHHKQVDDQVNTFTVEALHERKNAHERWVREQLGLFDTKRQTDDERYAAIVEEWEERAAVGEWKNWTSFVFGGGQPHIYRDRFEALEELRQWLFTRIWPKRYSELEEAFSIFRRVLSDFCNEFNRHVESHERDILWTRKFYQIDEWNEERYARLHREYQNHVGLVEDLMLELTRAANLVCDRVREHLIPNYRFAEGALTVERGPGLDLKFCEIRPEYSLDQRSVDPYLNLANFRLVRNERDYCIGDVED